MTNYIEFSTAEPGITVLVEADGEEMQPLDGVQKAGILSARKSSGHAVAAARVSFDVAMKRIVEENVRTLTDAMKEFATPPEEVELTFALKATGEAGNLAIAKVGGEANFQLRLLWKRPRQSLADTHGDRLGERPTSG